MVLQSQKSSSLEKMVQITYWLLECSKQDSLTLERLCVQPLLQVFQDVIHSGLDTIMPAKTVKICTADVPRMNESLKSLIMKRQKAFCAYGPDSAQFKYFRNLVNRQRKICRGKYYESKIQHLKGENPK